MSYTPPDHVNQRDSEFSSSKLEMSLLQYFSRVSKPDGVSFLSLSVFQQQL